METRHIKRLPVVQAGRLVGIVTRSDFLPAVAGLPKTTRAISENDDQIRSAVIAAMENAAWAPCGLNVSVKDGVVGLRGVVSGTHARQAAIVAAENIGGVKKVEDYMYDRAPPPEEDYGGGDFVSLQEEPSTTDDEPL
jgi:CBS domain-containing protein